jgi:hypothetical protein
VRRNGLLRSPLPRPSPKGRGSAWKGSQIRLGRACRVAIAWLSLVASGCGKAPQFVADEECFTAVDALWTSITAQQKPWLEDSARELGRLRDKGQLSPEAWEALASPIAQAHDGRWGPAARELRDLIKAQRKAEQR